MINRRVLGLNLGALSLALVAPQVAQARKPWPWPNGRQAAVSLTYDDGLNGQLDIGAGQLEAHGFRGTFFLTEENMEARLDDWVALERRGHEIGDHTMTHPCELRPYTPASFSKKQLKPMESFLDAHFQTPQPRLYAYPCGATELGRKGGVNRRQSSYVGLLRRNFLSARIVDGGP
ncbi:MAG: polysaccharide deacetylase family protein, partial [Caulobacteraceae bacterium]|nr:polysaccharide deacetylase family protein [Caulobacteraceae bacterium]